MWTCSFMADTVYLSQYLKGMSPMRNIIGIDPGFTGAIALLHSHNDLLIQDLPIKQYRGRKEIDGVAFSEYLSAFDSYTIAFAVMEDVSAMPKQGVTSMFRFGFATGVLLGVLNAHRISVLRVKPSVWKPALGLSRDKNKSIALAKKLFCSQKELFKLKKHDGRAEAALLAYYVRKNF